MQHLTMMANPTFALICVHSLLRRFLQGTPMGSGGGSGGGANEPEEEYLLGTEDGVLWGTTINVHTCMNVFK